MGVWHDLRCTSHGSMTRVHGPMNSTTRRFFPLFFALTLGCAQGGLSDGQADSEDMGTTEAPPDMTITEVEPAPPGPTRVTPSAGGGRVRSERYHMDVSISPPSSSPVLRSERYRTVVGVGSFVARPAPPAQETP